MDKLPNDWELVPIGKIAKTTAVGTLSRSNSANLKGVPYNKFCSGLTGFCFEAPNQTIQK